MKIALITLHAANNYGAVLQVFAMKKTLDFYGETNLIDYRPEHVFNTLKPIRFSLEVRSILRITKDILRYKERKKVIDKFWSFITNNFSLTERVYNKSEIERVLHNYDYVVSGSDQIWNPNVVTADGSIDLNYFLNFDLEIKKVAYASSMGTYKYNKNDEKIILNCLSNYKAISVREKDTKNYLNNKANLNVEHVLDPTLLLTKSEWKKIAKKPDNIKYEEYILVYALKKDILLKKVITELKNKTGLKVITIDQDPLLNYKPDQHLKDIGPDEFVYLFENAKFIITNSFHGTAFSCNLNKPFIVTEPPTGINRIVSLLSILGMQDRVVRSEESFDIHDLILPIDFDSMNEKLNLERHKSLTFLRENMK
ncbi:Polysaccharide pyruvyl transferase [Photobacterium malacitanum]|uniref:Polysaccharide pyruvyl transferase n=1 Tax=Photobacterium malacitanum TaxID=2204294 RepID=A0A1Y6MGA5_9GAMM|nr:polysaccharide pyruvyl transferase family protein [Photobacterium malacitanum]SMY35615.1 Polysaccharide pyruvyl transferase [Photobacterium malacitanum]